MTAVTCSIHHHGGEPLTVSPQCNLCATNPWVLRDASRFGSHALTLLILLSVAKTFFLDMQRSWFNGVHPDVGGELGRGSWQKKRNAIYLGQMKIRNPIVFSLWKQNVIFLFLEGEMRFYTFACESVIESKLCLDVTVTAPSSSFWSMYLNTLKWYFTCNRVLLYSYT